MKILIVGAGATGGYFGARLAEAGRDVTFLVRPARAQQLRASGLSLVSPHGNLTLAPRLVTAPEVTSTYDVVLLAVKAFGLDDGIRDVAPAVGPHTMILPILNGMKHLDQLVDRFGSSAILGGLCRINTTVDALGRIVQLNPLQELWYGERDGSMTDRIRALDATLQNPGFEARVTDSIEARMWDKWTLLAATGSIVCLLRGSLGEVARVPGGTEVAHAIVNEVVAVVTAAGHRPTPSFLEDLRSRLGDPRSEQTTSMYRDLIAGNPIEADQILGDLVSRARTLGVPTPLVSATYTQLRVYQSRAQGETGLRGRPQT